MRKANTGKSLKFKLLSLTLGTTLILGGASWGILRYVLKTQETSQLNLFQAYSRTLSDGIAAQFYERYGDVQAFAMNPSIQSSSQRTIIDTLNAYVALYGIYDIIMVVDATGRLVAVNDKNIASQEIASKPLYQKNYSDASWFKAVMSGQTTDDKAKNFAGTFVGEVEVDPYISQVYGGDKLGSSFSAAVKDASGKVIGVVTNRAGSRWFEVAFKELYAGMAKSGFASADLSLLNKDGRVVFEYFSKNPVELDESHYDWEVLLKYSPSEKGHAAAQSLLKGESGSMVLDDAHLKGRQVVGFTPVTSAKFTDALGWGVIVSVAQQEAMAAINQASMVFYVVLAAMLVGASLLSFWFSSRLSRTLIDLAHTLSLGSTEVSSAAESISTSSKQLSDASVEQASAIQETAASIDEVSSMVKKSADNASQSQKVSQSSREAAERGQTAVQEMIQSIGEISDSNNAIMSQVEEGNQKITEIARVISEIGTKTKVINDIVFQTKLLSFNASVEAARAGEHGKGFAVVAEEVGNLAQMSGNAAKEISGMLESSIQKVEGIVRETKAKVESLAVESRAKLESGKQVAQRCGDALNGILSSVQEVDGMVGEITVAAQEQSQGVSEINKAINQLDQVTQQNTAVAQKAASSAEQLSAQAVQLTTIVRDLFVLVTGADNEGGGSKQTGHAAPTQVPGKVISIAKKLAKKAAAAPGPEASGSTENKAAAASSAFFAASNNNREVPTKDDPRFEDV